MKKKHLEKKLVLNKSTLSNLDLSKMSKVYGGLETDPSQGAATIEKLCAIYSCGDACTWRPVCEGTYWGCD